MLAYVRPISGLCLAYLLGMHRILFVDHQAQRRTTYCSDCIRSTVRTESTVVEIHIEKSSFDPDYEAIARPRKFFSHVR